MPEPKKQQCYLCGQVLSDENLKIAPNPSNDTYEIECRMCGSSPITGEAKLEIEKLPQEYRVDLAAWVMEQGLRWRVAPRICSSRHAGNEEALGYRVNQILETLVPRSFSERLDRTLENLSILTGTTGEQAGLNSYGIYACFAGSPRKMDYYLTGLEERGWVRRIADDWCLPPGRYVGVAPEEVDEDFDFEETLREIHMELDDLNAEAVTLAATIKRNFEELGT